MYLSEEYHTTPMCGTKLTNNKMFIHIYVSMYV